MNVFVPGGSVDRLADDGREQELWWGRFQCSKGSEATNGSINLRNKSFLAAVSLVEHSLATTTTSGTSLTVCNAPRNFMHLANTTRKYVLCSRVFLTNFVDEYALDYAFQPPSIIQESRMSDVSLYQRTDAHQLVKQAKQSHDRGGAPSLATRLSQRESQLASLPFDVLLCIADSLRVRDITALELVREPWLALRCRNSLMKLSRRVSF